MTRFFLAKVWLASIGVAVGLLGIAAERRWVVGLGVACLGVAFLLRFAERAKPESP